MTARDARLAAFLAGSRFASWTRAPLAGDASARRYDRLTGPGGETAILMEAPPGSGESIAPFTAIAAHLSAIGLCPPEVILADPEAGLALLSDLGPMQAAQWLAAHPDDEETVYAAAVDVLAELQSHPPPPGLVALTPEVAAAMIAPLGDWYAPGLDTRPAQEALREALAAHAPEAGRLALRDYHAENLIWRPDRQGLSRIGLLDFQDAVLAPPAYDLVSLLRDARRDVADALRERMIDRFAGLTGQDPTRTRAACACLGVQRNLRILGIFARLARRDGKARYLDLMPRVFAHVLADLGHPALARLRPLLEGALPPPDAAHLDRLRVA